MIAIQREDRFDFRSAEYERLYERSDATPFQHPQWLHRLYGSLAPEVGAEPVIVTGRDADGELRLLLPLVRRRVRLMRRVEFADLGVCDYAAPVIERAYREAVLAPETEPAVRKAIGRADLIVVEKIAADPEAFVRLLGARSIRRHDYDAHAIKLPDTFEAWRESLDPKVVRHVDRKRKRVGGNGRRLRMRELDSTEEVDAAFDAMRAFRQARFGDRRAVDLVQTACYFDFYRQVARDSMQGAGPASTSLLTVNDETVGVSFSVYDAEQDLFLLIGYDFAHYRNYSLGLIMVEELIATAIGDGKRYYDLTIGHDGYKTDFGATPTAMYAVRAPRTVRGRAGLVAEDREAGARRFAKRVLRYWEAHRPKLLSLRLRRR